MAQEQANPTLLLVVESNNSARLVSKHLDRFFNVVTAEDAESAWDALQECGDISLLICELKLAIDRFGLLERLRNAGDSWLAATPLLLLVGETDNEAGRELAFQMGATDFINLPFASSELCARARLHANLYLQNFADPERGMREPVAAANLLQQLSQQNFFNSRARQELSFSQRHRSALSLCKLKLDGVAAIVAEHDKATAITAVKAVAKLIQQTLRREESLCYLGNGEFHLLYPATNGIGATAALNRILKKVAGGSIMIGATRLRVSLSGAVFSCIASEAMELEQIYQKLDQGVAQASASGGNQLVSTGNANEQRELSVDRALQLIAAGNTKELSRHARPLLLGVLPLLEFAAGELEPGLESICDELRSRLESGG